MPDHRTDQFEIPDGIASRRIGRTKSYIVKIEKALGDKVLLIEKSDGSIYATTNIEGKMVKVL